MCMVRCFRRFWGVEDSSALEHMIFGDVDGIAVLVKSRGSKELLEPVLADRHAFDGNRLLRSVSANVCSDAHTHINTGVNSRLHLPSFENVEHRRILHTDVFTR